MLPRIFLWVASRRVGAEHKPRLAGDADEVDIGFRLGGGCGGKTDREVLVSGGPAGQIVSTLDKTTGCAGDIVCRMPG